MIEQLPTMAKLIKSLQQVPYLASKNVYRVAEYFLLQDSLHLKQFCDLLMAAHERIRPCHTCYAWYEVGGGCVYCHDKKRDQSLICVVETWQELLVIEKTKGHQGVYHILGGVISPLEGRGPDDLTIDALVARAESGGVAEFILALNQTAEGEATSAYIAKKLKPSAVKISCLARGLPVGSSLDAMDRLTVFKALSERRPLI